MKQFRPSRLVAAPAILLSGLVVSHAQVPTDFFGGQLETELNAYRQFNVGKLNPAANAQRQEAASAKPLPDAPEVPRRLDAGVFGGELFRGTFAAESFQGFNPDYVVRAGDAIDLRMWGAVDTSLRLVVDTQGHVFVPRVGPVRIASIRNSDLNSVLGQRIKEIYRENVGVYAALALAEPVKVFVTGEVQAPGLYGAYASDSLLHFLDRAGGIEPRKGSYLDVRLRRNGRVVQRFNLYDFLLSGILPLYQFQNGDTLVVGPKQKTVTVRGRVNHEGLFEFSDRLSLEGLLAMAGVDARATHVQLIRHEGVARGAQYLNLRENNAADFWLASGDEVLVREDRTIGEIVASVDGEFVGPSQFVLPYESVVADLLAEVEVTGYTELNGVQLYRRSLADRQKEVLNQMLQKLEHSVLSARSSTREEADLRNREADLVLRFIERAKDIKPLGQLILHQGFDAEKVMLEDQDRIFLPKRSDAIAVQGEVAFPNSFIFQPGKRVSFYLEQAGGLSQRANQDQIFVRRVNGAIVEVKQSWFDGGNVKLKPGDEILVLPMVDTKKFQFSKDLVQIIYQIALSAGVVLSI